MDVDLFPGRDRMGFVPILSCVSFSVLTLIVRNNRGPAPDDILLGDFGGKIDED